MESGSDRSQRARQSSAGDLVGREEELGRLLPLVEPPFTSAQVLVLLGDAGIGKSALLAAMVDQAQHANMHVLRIAGSESEANLGFAALHQLLRPVLHGAADLAPRQRQALLGAFGLADELNAVDRLLISIASLTLLSDVSERTPLLVVIDDAHWLDSNSMDVIAFVARRLENEPIVLIVSARGTLANSGFSGGFPLLRVEPLSSASANQLLDKQPYPPKGATRSQVLAQSAGNPLGLIELAKVIAADPDAGRSWTAEPLPLNDRLEVAFAGKLVGLAGPTREALLLAAAADSSDLPSIVRDGLAGLDSDVWLAAARADLVILNRDGARFAHPLVRSAVYHAAGFPERAAAHRKLAALLKDMPDRKAWHLAAAAEQPDESVAAMLETTAVAAQQRGGSAAAALALARAAELSPDREGQARRLTTAAEIAISTGQAAWVEELSARAVELSTDSALKSRARRARGWALAWTNRSSDALAVLLSVAEEPSGHPPGVTLSALSLAATVAYQSGEADFRQAVTRALGRIGQSEGTPAEGPVTTARVMRLWVRAALDPFGNRAETVPELQRLLESHEAELPFGSLGAAAWVLDETEAAVDKLRRAVHNLQAPSLRGMSGSVLSALAWAYIDSGRWDDALAVSAESATLASAYKMEMVAASAAVSAATLHALRGNSEAARQHATEALNLIEPYESRSVLAHGRRITGLAAEADGNYKIAYAHLQFLFAQDGAPLHYHVSYLGLADLARVAVRAERRMEARQRVERALEHLGGTPSPRVAQLIGCARALLAEPIDAGIHFETTLSSSAGERWPFERAQLQLEYAEWLRRRRRITEARPLLLTALEVFRRLRATRWTERAARELRASGVTVPGTAEPLSDFSPQQRQIVVLASQGLTNREIGDRLYLSPRTVGSHLYRSFPRLGITRRSQLHDVLSRL